jgi:hypothetical protein
MGPTATVRVPSIWKRTKSAGRQSGPQVWPVRCLPVSGACAHTQASPNCAPILQPEKNKFPQRIRLRDFHFETFATIFISVIPLVGINLATWIAVHAGNGPLM